MVNTGSPSRTGRVLRGLVLAIGLAGCGFALGAVIGGRCCVPADSGLAAGAIVVGYGLLGAFVGVAGGVVLAWWLPIRALTWTTVIAGAGGIAVMASILTAVLAALAEQDAHLEAAYQRLPAFRMTLSRADPAGLPFRSFSARWQQRETTASYGGRACRGSLSGGDAVTLLGALREVEVVMAGDPFPCAGTLGAELYRLEFFIPSPTPPDSTATLRLTAACLERHPQLGGPLAAVESLTRAADWPDACPATVQSRRSNTTARLFARMSTTARTPNPQSAAAATSDSRSRIPQAGFSARNATSNRALPSDVYTPSRLNGP